MTNGFIVWRAAVLSRRAVPERSGVVTLARGKWRKDARPSASGESFLISVSIDFQESMVNRKRGFCTDLAVCAFHAKQCAGD